MVAQIRLEESMSNKKCGLGKMVKQEDGKTQILTIVWFLLSITGWTSLLKGLIYTYWGLSTSTCTKTLI